MEYFAVTTITPTMRELQHPVNDRANLKFPLLVDRNQQDERDLHQPSRLPAPRRSLDFESIEQMMMAFSNEHRVVDPEGMRELLASECSRSSSSSSTNNARRISSVPNLRSSQLQQLQETQEEGEAHFRSNEDSSNKWIMNQEHTLPTSSTVWKNKKPDRLIQHKVWSDVQIYWSCSTLHFLRYITRNYTTNTRANLQALSSLPHTAIWSSLTIKWSFFHIPFNHMLIIATTRTHSIKIQFLRKVEIQTRLCLERNQKYHKKISWYNRFQAIVNDGSSSSNHSSSCNRLDFVPILYRGISSIAFSDYFLQQTHQMMRLLEILGTFQIARG